MKFKHLFIPTLIILLSGCLTQSGTHNADSLEAIRLISYFKVTKVEPQMDGDVIYLKGANKRKYCTIVSIPNGNYINLHKGDIITMEVTDIYQVDELYLTSKNITIKMRFDER